MDHRRPSKEATLTPDVPELPPYRPPSEADSILIRVTRGCAWNRCAFCSMYKELSFERRPFDDILRDISAWRTIQPHPRSIFLADSDSLKHPRLIEIVAELRRVFPEAPRITSYTRLTTLAKMEPDRLLALREAGLDRLHAGLESGSERVRKRVRKALPEDHAIEGSRRAIDAGFQLSLYILSGLGGEEDFEEHGRESGRLVARIWPHFLRLRSLVVLPGTPLMEEQQAGEFHGTTPLTRLREVRLMLEQLDPPDEMSGEVDHELEVCSDHFTNYVWSDHHRLYSGIDGRLPTDKAALLALLDRAIEHLNPEDALDPAALARQGRNWSM
jgi:radical SAM superfamily enzyme YgiQ (UPF0313 family)